MQKVNKKLEEEKKVKLSSALRSNLQKRKLFQKKINNKVDLFERGHEYQVLKLNEDFPEYILENLEKYGEFIIK